MMHRSHFASLGLGSCLVMMGCGSSASNPETPDAASSFDAGLDAVNAGDGGALDTGLDAAPPCSGQAGTFHSQKLVVNGEDRFYYVHVPPTYQCKDSWPVLVDFHGTGFGNATDPVEESWALDELVAAADAEHFIVLRPRSRSQASGGQYLFQWDINPGDLALNRDFALALLGAFEASYHVDPARVYASGFSNGPNMAAQFLADDPPIVHGYGLVAGGLWTDPVRAKPFDANAPRIYSTTGYRDYMLSTQRHLIKYLGAASYPMDHFWRRESDTGHELYGWHYREMFGWMDRNQRPAEGTLAAGWTRETFAGTDSLTQIARAPNGSIVAAASDGAIYRRDPTGAWTLSTRLAKGSFGPSLSDICFLPTGTGFVVGDTAIAKTTDGTTWSMLPAVPEFGSNQFGFAYLTSIGCSGTRVVGGAVWSAATSGDEGATWSAASILQSGVTPFMSAVRAAPDGSWVSTGYYDYIGHSTDGVTFAEGSEPAAIQWFNDAAGSPGGHWWVVGEKGTIGASTDGGATWTLEDSKSMEDLYAVAFHTDGQRGVAVGAHGTALVTTNAGATWTLRSTGLDGFLGDAKWLDDTTVMVVGEKGTVLTTKL